MGAVKLNWNSRISLDGYNVVLRAKTSVARPRITIGLPTYRRADVLNRALASLAAQHYRQFVVIVSDNNGCNPETLRAVTSYSTLLPEVLLVAQSKNIGAIENLKFLLAAAETEYFMWLADDDEVSEDYLMELIKLLDDDPCAVSAAGRWMEMVSPIHGTMHSKRHLSTTYTLGRLLQFALGHVNDYVFYGLHRTAALRACSFGGYLPPNRDTLTGWCYPFLYDMALQGYIAYSDSAVWINHDYSEKNYATAPSQTLSDRLKSLFRKFNIKLLYVAKTVRQAPLLLIFVVSGSLFGFVLEIFKFIIGFLRGATAR